MVQWLGLQNLSSGVQIPSVPQFVNFFTPSKKHANLVRMDLRPYLIFIQKKLILYQPLIKTFFVIAEIGVISLWIVGLLMFVMFPYQDLANFRLHLMIYDIGTKMGVIGLLTYFATLTPGILQRFRFQPLVAAMIMPFRRHMGILMFLCVVVHMNFTTTLPFVLGGAGLVLTSPKVFGVVAWLLLLPLWLTSNDPSQKYLGKKWKLLHRLTYLVLLLVFFHVALFLKNWAIPTFGMLILEASSWLIVLLRSRQSTAAVTSIQ